LASLIRCLTMAEPEGYVRLFLDGGRPLAPLLYTAVQQGVTPAYGSRLLALLAEKMERPLANIPDQGPAQPLIEPLSERELEVLHHLATGLTNREIGLRLHLSPNTIKRHTLNIYEKLDVHSRTEAVTKARDFGILS